MAINIKPSHKGLLHKDLGVHEGKPIPAKKLEQAEHSKNPKIRKRAQFAENAKGFKHPGKPEQNPKARADRAQERKARGGMKRRSATSGFEDSSLKSYDHTDYRHTSGDR